MRNLPSNPRSGVDSRPDQVAEPLLHIRNATQAVCGRCSALPHNWKVSFSFVTPPPEEQQFLFNNVHVYREPIQRFVPSIVLNEILQQGPTLRYIRCHFLSTEIGPYAYPSYPLDASNPDKVLVSIPNTQWFLFYGGTQDNTEGVEAGGFDFRAPQQLDEDPLVTDEFVANNVISTPLEFDSKGEAAGNEFNDPMTFSGWILALLWKRIRRMPPPDGPFKIAYDSLAVYRLVEPELDQLPVFKSWRSNSFEIFHNPLQLPSHTVTISPLL